MLQNLNSKYSRRSFFGVLVILFMVSCRSLWYLNEIQSTLSTTQYNFFQALIIALITALGSSLFMASMYWFFLPKEKELKQIIEIDPQTTIEYFDKALLNSTYWGYHGHIGRWIRNAAIPAFEKKAGERGESISIDIIILDPLNENVCKLFAEYKNVTRFRERQKPDVSDIQAELYATILKSIIANQSGALDINVFLSSSFSGLRKDISDSSIFITRVDPRAPAMVVLKEEGKNIETMYAMLNTDFKYTKKQSREVNFSSCGDTIDSKSNINDYLNALVNVGVISNITDINDKLAVKISSAVQSEYHPYS